MSHAAHVARARRPRGDLHRPAVAQDVDLLAPHLEDAAHYPGGRASGLAVPADEAQISALLTSAAAVLPIGAQSSLTGGATPMGEILLSTARLNRILDIGRDAVRVQAGVPLTELDRALLAAGRYYPPTPTFFGAFVGGTIATNAAGAATFKYGATRGWVRALTVVLPTGDVLDLVRGDVRAHADGYFDLALSGGTVRVPVPGYRLPDVPKVSAGYFAEPRMDLVDLFIGSEGTLGVVVEATLEVRPERPAICLALVPFAERPRALAFVRQLRAAAHEAWLPGASRGLDVSAIEHMDARSLALVREDGVDRSTGISLPPETAMALLVTLELPPSTSPADAFDQIGRALDTDAPDTPLVRFCRTLADFGVLDDVQLAVPGDRPAAERLLAIREAVPAAVNARVGRAKQAVDPRIEKTAADMIVPFDRVEPLLALYDDAFRREGLDVAVWGHISDGNVHPNVLPGSLADVEAGKRVILECGRQVIKWGGSPLAEHGVGRNPIKQQMLADLYGAEGVEAMRRVKRAIDPAWRLAPGVLFSKS